MVHMGNTHRKLGCMLALWFAFAPLGRAQEDKVAGCNDCRTPRLSDGQPDRSNMLRGAALDFAPIHPVPNWNKMAPDLTPGGKTWKNWGEAGLVKFLETALDPRGHPADPPMPAYKLHAADAEAVVAYLKTLQ